MLGITTLMICGNFLIKFFLVVYEKKHRSKENNYCKAVLNTVVKGLLILILGRLLLSVGVGFGNLSVTAPHWFGQVYFALQLFDEGHI